MGNFGEHNTIDKPPEACPAAFCAVFHIFPHNAQKGGAGAGEKSSIFALEIRLAGVYNVWLTRGTAAPGGNTLFPRRDRIP